VISFGRNDDFFVGTISLLGRGEQEQPQVLRLRSG
jgi:hypothetical protein